MKALQSIKNNFYAFSLLATMALSPFANAVLTSAEQDRNALEGNLERSQECKVLSKNYIGNLSAKEKFSAECYTNYLLFNGDAQSQYDEDNAKAAPLKISSLNVWNIGSGQTRFKDLYLVAKLMNQWDMVSMVEVLPLVGADAKFNNALVKAISKMKGIESKAKSGKNLSSSDRSLKKINKTSKNLMKHMRAPGYLQLLRKLRAIDPTWALIIAPRETSRAGLAEMGAYFFRANKIKLRKNAYCEYIKENGEGIGYGCMPRYHEYKSSRKAIMDKDYRHLFSKRPFMASFISGDFDFTGINVHTQYRTPPKKDDIDEILRLAYGVTSYKEVPGLTGTTYHRFGEINTTLKFMNKMISKKFPNGVRADKDIIFMGDFNVGSKSKYWKTSLKNYEGAELFITDETSLSESYRRKNGSGYDHTNGTANNFDHFLFNPSHISECNGNEAKMETFHEKKSNLTENEIDIARLIHKKYRVRSSKVINAAGDSRQ
ncbi:MAG: hypothetical protein ACI9QD_000611, partial [Thermoproteota archaeon]